jgi:hypothetical protein
MDCQAFMVPVSEPNFRDVLPFVKQTEAGPGMPPGGGKEAAGFKAAVADLDLPAGRPVPVLAGPGLDRFGAATGPPRDRMSQNVGTAALTLAMGTA